MPTEEPTRPDHIVEVQLRKFKILTWPKVKYFSRSLTKEVYVSRADTVKEMITRICNSTIYDEVSDKIGHNLISACRLWVMEGDTDFQDVVDALDGKNMPTEICGRVLEPH